MSPGQLRADLAAMEAELRSKWGRFVALGVALKAGR